MKRYDVLLSEQAESEADKAYLWIQMQSPEGAARWWHGLRQKDLPVVQGKAKRLAWNGMFKQEIADDDIRLKNVSGLTLHRG